MEISRNSESQIDSNTELNFHTDSDSEEDDLFYVELRKQILLLTTEEDGENENITRNRNYRSTRGAKQGLNHALTISALPGSYYSWCENNEGGKGDNVPIWLVNLWRHGSGTGVFIPHIPKTRRRNKQGRRSSSKRTIYVPVQPNKS